MHTYADTAPSRLSDDACDATYGAGVDPKRVPRSSLVDLHQGTGLMIIAQQLPWETWRGLPRCSRVTLRGEDGGLPMSHCCAVMIQSPLLKGRVHACACGQKDHLRTPRWPAPHRKSRPAAQRSGGHRGVATRKATGDPATRRGAGDPETRAE